MKTSKKLNSQWEKQNAEKKITFIASRDRASKYAQACRELDLKMRIPLIHAMEDVIRMANGMEPKCRDYRRIG